MSEGAVRHDGPIDGHGLYKLADVAALDVVDGAPAPDRQHDIVEHMDSLPPAVLARLPLRMLLDKLMCERVDGVAGAIGGGLVRLGLGVELEHRRTLPRSSSCNAAVAAFLASANESPGSSVSLRVSPR